MIDPETEERALDALARFNAGRPVQAVRAAEPELSSPDNPGPPEPDEDPPESPNGHVVVTAKGASLAHTPAHLRYPTLDWHRAFDGAPDDVDWLVEEFLIRGSSYSLVCAAEGWQIPTASRHRSGLSLGASGVRASGAATHACPVRRPREQPGRRC